MILQGSSDGASESGSDEDEEDEGTPQIDASQLSFGALAKAQSALGSSARRRRADTAEEKADDESTHPTKGDHETEKKKKKPEKEKRPSKHAPAVASSKFPVSRKRDFLTVTAVELKKPQPRDPRFMPLGPGATTSSSSSSSKSKIEEIKARKAYAFLDEYRESEMRQLREAIKKTKNAAQREELQKALMSMESRKKAQERKDKERAVIEEHRKKEKELVKQGKKPFYLKRSEQKKRVLVDQFQGMKKKQVDKVIERRRKKIAGKEKKLLPLARRGAEDR
jgi:ribosomal RNA-processing protein 36